MTLWNSHYDYSITSSSTRDYSILINVDSAKMTRLEHSPLNSGEAFRVASDEVLEYLFTADVLSTC